MLVPFYHHLLPRHIHLFDRIRWNRILGAQAIMGSICYETFLENFPSVIFFDRGLPQAPLAKSRR
jgi:hypothetical protein